MHHPILVVLLAAFVPAHACASVQAQPKAPVVPQPVVRQIDGDTTNLDLGHNAIATAGDAKDLRKALVDRIHSKRVGGVYSIATDKEREALAGDVAKKLESQVDYAKEQIVLVRMMTGGPPFGTLRHEIGTDPNKKEIVFFVQAPRVDGGRGKAAQCLCFFFAVPAGFKVTIAKDERPTAAAQQDPPAKKLASVRAELQRAAIAQLYSDDLATAAWGAYNVAESRLGDCAADVRKRLALLAGRTGKEGAERRAAVALLDALIETDAAVPSDELAPFAELGAPAIVLMARAPAANRASLLHAFGPASAGMWDERQACGNLLAQVRDPDFVLLLLRGPWQRWVYVVDPGATKDLDPDCLDWLGFPGGGVGCSVMPAPAGFPPLARHTLETDGGPGCRLVAPGHVSVFLKRSWYHEGLHCSRWSGYRELRIARAAWLEQMLGAEQRAAIRAIDEPVAIEWKDRAAIDEYAQQAARAAEPTWRALVKACVDAKLLTVDPEREPAPALQFEFLDGRKDQTVPLPPSPDGRRK